MFAETAIAAANAPSAHVLASTLLAVTEKTAATVGIKERIYSAQRLMIQGHAENARAILLALKAEKIPDVAEANEIQFLLGLLDVADKDYESAVHRYHTILISEPKAIRVRLELGRTYFLAGDYANAERQFLFARAGRLPPAVLKNIDKYLGAIRSLKTVAYTVSLSIASDTNINAGPATDSISLYGLPFQLSQSAKANSGIGIAIDGSVEWALRLNKDLKWRTGAQLHRAQYGQTQFDDMTIGIFTGPHVTFKKWDFNLLGNFARRWYGDHVYAEIVGGGADATYYITPRLGIGAGLNLLHIGYSQNSLQTGLAGNVFGSLFYTPTAASIIRGSIAAGYQDARASSFANRNRQFSLSYTREFKGGLTLTLTPAYTHIAYEASLGAFNKTRVDDQFTGQLVLLHRRLDWHGFTPRISYTYIRNDSSVSLFVFRRSRVEFGITSAF